MAWSFSAGERDIPSWTRSSRGKKSVLYSCSGHDQKIYGRCPFQPPQESLEIQLFEVLIYQDQQKVTNGNISLVPHRTE